MSVDRACKALNSKGTDMTDSPTARMRVCVDCAMLHANSTTEGLTPEREQEVLAGLEDYPFLDIGDDDGFSWASCDACGSHLGGDRFIATEGGPARVTLMNGKTYTFGTVDGETVAHEVQS